MKRAVRFFENLLFPPRCAACHGLMQKNILDLCEDPLCDRCRLEWEREKGESCPDCGLEMLACRCYPDRMRKAGFSDAIKLVNYRSDRETAGRRAILHMKKHLNAKSFDFFAEQLSYPVKRYMDDHGLSAQQVVFCHVPRGKKNVAQYGFDQSAQLCRRLAACCGAQAYDVIFRRSGRDAEQKKLSAQERAENAQNKFDVDKDVLSAFAGKVKCLFLVDDVITTGSSLCGCAKQLTPCFDGTVVAVAIARTPLGRRTSSF